MKIILNNINYKERHFDRYEVDIPNVTDVNDVSEKKIMEEIINCLEISIKHYKDRG